MRDDGSRFSLFGMMLQAFSDVYAAGLRGRQKLYHLHLLKKKSLPCRVVSIGNVTVGGTGKTPMTIYAVRLVQELGYKAAVVSRGYKGGAEKSGGVVSDGQSVCMTPESAGDEPYLLAESLKGTPVLVGRDRFASGLKAVQAYGVDVVVLDDAFQHIRLKRDIDLVLLDDRRPLGNGRLLPRGLLREPADALRRCDAVILTRCPKEQTATAERIRKLVPGRPIFRSRHVPFIARIVGSADTAGRVKSLGPVPDGSGGLRVFAFSGLADNLNFRDSLAETGFRVVDFSSFPDHHAYTDRELAGILQSAQESGAEAVATTEKDFSKVTGRVRWPLQLVVMGVRVSFDGEEAAFKDFIQNRLNR